jgi:hypothetical protein
MKIEVKLTIKILISNNKDAIVRTNLNDLKVDNYTILRLNIPYLI